MPGFQQYDRIALAEAVLERDEHGTRPSTYLAFPAQYGEGGPGSADWVSSARVAVARLTGSEIDKIDELLDLLGPIAHQTAAATGLDTSIIEKESELKARRERRAKAARGSQGSQPRPST